MRKMLKVRVLGLASLLHTMARQRSRLLFLAEGDANTKFFHLMACHRKRSNYIHSLCVEGTEVVRYEAMAQALFQYYDHVLSSNFVRSRRIDLSLIGLPSADLSGLEMRFTEEEVWSVISELPNEATTKRPALMGFTGILYKTAWPIIKGDVMNAFNVFWTQDTRSLNLLNDAYMMLLKKKKHPEEIKDYRPIRLIHSFGKLITKCLPNRLALVLDGLVPHNQTAFIKGRCIHDNFRTVRLSCKAIHARRTLRVLLKIDITKAFDSVAWNFLLEVLTHMGFGMRWRNWISSILSTASTTILLNGRPRRRICHARGLREGDSLLPMLFVLVMEVLNHLFGWLDDQGFLTPLGITLPYRLSLYADDVILFVAPRAGDLQAIKAVVQIFGLASGLFSNLDNSVATPFGCSEHEVNLVQDTLSCRTENFPCRHLGIPLSIYKLKRLDEQKLIDSVASRIPQWKGNLLNLAGQTALVRATLSAIPAHVSIAFGLSPWAPEQIDKQRQAFIWGGDQTISGGKCKVAGETVCKLRELGGLGVVDLRRTGYAFRAC